MAAGPARGANNGRHQIIIPPSLERTAADRLAVVAALCTSDSPARRPSEFAELRRALFSLTCAMESGSVIDAELTVPSLPASEVPHLAWIKQAELAVAIAQALGLPLSERVNVAMAGALAHVSHAELRRQVTRDLRPLDDRVYRRHLATHPTVSFEMLQHAGLRDAYVADVAQHHEAWDGSGSPRGLRGRAIALGARVIAVADAHVDVAGRSNLGSAVRAVKGGSGRAFDPEIVGAYLRVLSEETTSDALALTAAERRQLERSVVRTAGPTIAWRPVHRAPANHQRDAVVRPTFTGASASQALRRATLRPEILRPQTLRPRSLGVQPPASSVPIRPLHLGAAAPTRRRSRPALPRDATPRMPAKSFRRRRWLTIPAW